MMDNYYQPWISDEEPKPPKGWGVAVYTGKRRKEPFRCAGCGNDILFRQEYVYSFKTTGVVTVHNREECCASIVN